MSVQEALARADYVGTDSTGSDEWDRDLAALAALAAEVRRLNVRIEFDASEIRRMRRIG